MELYSEIYSKLKRINKNNDEKKKTQNFGTSNEYTPIFIYNMYNSLYVIS